MAQAIRGYRRLWWCICLPAALTGYGAAGTALAVAGINAWPSKVEVKASAGELKTGVITIQNQGLSKVPMEAVVLNMTMDREGVLVFTDNGLPTGLRQWLTVKPTAFEVNPRSSQQILYALKIPADAQGTNIGAVLFIPTGERERGEPYQGSIGTIFIQTVPGTGTKSADLSGLNIAYIGGQLTARLLLENTGTLVFNPVGSITVTDPSGRNLGNYALNAAGEFVLPRTSREFEVPLEGIGDSAFKLLATVDYGGSEILQGETFFSGGRQSQTALQNRDKGKEVTSRPPAGRLSGEEIDKLTKTGVKLYAEGSYQKALEIWQRLRQADPGNSKVKQYLERTKQKLEAMKRANR